MCEVHKDEKINKKCCGCSEHNHKEHNHKEHNHKEHNHKEHHHEHHHEHGCGCGHDHEHGGDIEGKEIAKIFLAGIFLVAAIFVGKYSY